MPTINDAAVAAMSMKEMELEVISHNLANASSYGFKEGKVSFEAVLSEEKNNNGEPKVVNRANITTNFSPGATIQTNNTFDLALQGDGFFEVQTDHGNFYSRDGAFTLNAQGQLVTLHGDPVMGVSGPVQIGTKSKVEISESGQVNGDGEDLGQIKVVSFDDKQKLSAVGNGLFEAKDGVAAKPTTDTQILQGKLESSNSQMTTNMVRLIEVMRQYESYLKVIQAQKDIDKNSSTVGQLA